MHQVQTDSKQLWSQVSSIVIPRTVRFLTSNRNNNKPVDLSRLFRQTGLTSGAKLELVAASRTPTAITVALQIPESLASGIPNGRMIDKFATNTTIWKILRHFEDTKERNLNFTGRGAAQIAIGNSGAGRVCYEMPTVHAMNRELSTFGDLQKTLAQLGLSGGNCLLKLAFKQTDQPLEEAMQEIQRYFKEEGPKGVSASSSEPIKEEQEPVADETVSTLAEEASGSRKEDVEMTLESVPVREEADAPKTVAIGASQRPVIVYNPPSADMPRAALQPHNENDYEPSIAHAKLHQSRLLNNSQNKRLLSDAETEQLEKEKAEKLSGATKVSIKIRFPDQSQILSSFNAQESGLDLYNYVTEAVVAEIPPFKLVYNNNKGQPQTVPRDEKKLLIKHLGLSGAVLVNFHWEDQASVDIRKQPILKPLLLESAQEVKVPEVAAVETTEEEAGPSVIDKGKGKETSGGGAKKGLPKWFTAGKKK